MVGEKRERAFRGFSVACSSQRRSVVVVGKRREKEHYVLRIGNTEKLSENYLSASSLPPFLLVKGDLPLARLFPSTNRTTVVVHILRSRRRERSRRLKALSCKKCSFSLSQIREAKFEADIS